MNLNHDKVTERRMRRSIQRAFERAFDSIAKRPTLVIESGDDEESVSSRALNEIREWLFRGR
jgi:hypothetical protein